jgi:RNA polymerase sigma factor (sigma-70 family)
MLSSFGIYARRILIKGGYSQRIGNLDDVVQLATIRLWTQLKYFKSQSKFSTWANDVAKSVALNEIERLRGQAGDNKGQAVITDDGDYNDEYETQVIEFEELVQTLSGNDTIIIHLFRNGWKQKDIAKFFKKNEVWVSKRMRRIEKQLRMERNANRTV